jgi:hypothetical protein
MTITTKPCPLCGKTSTLEDINPMHYQAWQGGMLIQRAFPELNADERELLITGTHPACWDKITGGDED